MRNLILLLSLALLLSCSNEQQGGKKATVKGKSSSAPYELLVVCNKDWLATANGEALKTIVNAEIPGLPQSESYFRTTTIDPSNFNSSFMYYAHVVRAEVSRKYAKAECKVARDVYCQPQIIVSLTAPDDAAFAQLCDQHRQQIIELFNNAELQREKRLLAKKSSPIVTQHAKKMFGCRLLAPGEINAIKTGRNFFWASSNTETDNYLNICMYSYPYTSPETFTLPYFVQQRDSFMRPNIRGNHDNQYMSLNEQTLMTRDLMVNGHYVQEVRGLWQMAHDAMGGPFVSYSQVDTTQNRVLVVEGFVFAPNKEKRFFMRQLEAALQTLEVIQ